MTSYCYVIVKAAFSKQVQFSYAFLPENLFEVVIPEIFSYIKIHNAYIYACMCIKQL